MNQEQTIIINKRITRNSLSAQAVNLLRDAIINGQIPQGTKLVERTVAELLGISRAPARDALIELERDGLIVTKSSGRHVIELSKHDIKELLQIRLALETLALELAIQNKSSTLFKNLDLHLAAMKDAIQNNDHAAYVNSDINMHSEIWTSSANQRLEAQLNSMVGPIFMFIKTNAEIFDWKETYHLHVPIVDAIRSGDVVSGRSAIRIHMDSTLTRSLNAYEQQKKST